MDCKRLAIEIKHMLNLHLENKVSDVIIFGSQVNGKANADSDYDVLIILNCLDCKSMRRTIYDLCYEIDLKYDIFLDIQIMTENDVKFGIWGKHPVIENAIKEGVHA